MEDKAMQVVQGVKPNVVNWIGAAIGAALAWWTGLPPLAQALLIVQGADIVTGLLCAVTGKSRKTESGKVSSGTLLMGVMKKGLEWLVVGVCVSVGNGLGEHRMIAVDGEETADSAEGESVTVCAQGGLRMRKKPKGRYMQMIPDGAQLAVLEEKDGWLRVEYRGFTGWISGEYCCKAGED